MRTFYFGLKQEEIHEENSGRMQESRRFYLGRLSPHCTKTTLSKNSALKLVFALNLSAFRLELTFQLDFKSRFFIS